MSVKIMSEVFEKSRTEGNARLVLLALADCANDDGGCWPSLSKLASKANLSEPTAKKYLSALVAIGLVSKEKREASDGRQTSNLYQIDANMIGRDFLPKEAIQSVTPPSRLPKGEGVMRVSGGGGNAYYLGEGVTPITPSYMNRQSEPSSEPPMSVGSKKQDDHELHLNLHLEHSQTNSGEAKPRAKREPDTVAAPLRSKSAAEAHNVSLAILKAWNATGLKRISSMTDSRKKAVSKALRGIEGFRERWPEALEAASRSAFLRGEERAGGKHANWTFTVDHFLTDRFFAKLLDGFYAPSNPSQDDEIDKAMGHYAG